jgi:5-methylcytosine-specific restriction enzyme subunit McrC
VACEWDEFSPDTPLARILRCAAEVLLARTRLPGAAADLRDAVAMLNETESIRAKEALSDAASIRWSRLNARWRPCYELAIAALNGLGRELHAGDTESFVFLLDMNSLFEKFCARWLEQKFDVAISEQEPIGYLLKTPNKRRQDPDLQWRHEGTIWIGDAKYKRRRYTDWPDISDLRQLICYGRLAEKAHAAPSRLMLLYPTTSAESAETLMTFENQMLELHAVRIVR